MDIGFRMRRRQVRPPGKYSAFPRQLAQKGLEFEALDTIANTRDFAAGKLLSPK
jgi:hypothetical protein